MLRKFKDCKKIQEFLRFLIVGVIATIIHLLAYSLFQLNGFQYNISYTLGYAISLIFNFFASNYFTFKTKPNRNRGLGFLFAHSFNYILQMTLLNIYINLGINKSLAPLLVFIISIPTNFLFVKFVLKNDKGV